MNIGILASRRGSNFGAIVAHERLGVLNDVDVSVLVYNYSDAPAATIAETQGVPSRFIDHRNRARQEFEREIIETLDSYNVELVCLAGWDRIIGSEFFKKYRWRAVNIHPALLPAFGEKGLNAGFVHEAALEYGVKVTGCTVYFIDVSVEKGPIILQKPVEIRQKETSLFSVNREQAVGMLSDRVLVQEHRLYSKAIQLYADKLLHVSEFSVEVGASPRRVVSVHSDSVWEKEWALRQRKFIEAQIESWKSSTNVSEEDLL